MIHCDKIIFSGDALIRMFDRKISKQDVKNIILNNEVVAKYSDDKPYPSAFLLGYVKNRPIHVVVAINITDHSCILVTAYAPSLKIWNMDYKTRRKK